MVSEASLRGRQSEARRNDARILEAALDLLSRDSTAPMSAVARAAGVGQASLYRRYPDRDSLLVAVCERGLSSIAERSRAALADPDPGAALADFVEWYAGSGSLRMTALLGTFTPPQHLFDIAHQANVDMQSLVERAADAGALRRDVTGADLTLIAVQLGALDAGDPERTATWRRRYLTLALQALARTDAPPLPGPAPDSEELEAPWRERAWSGGRE